MTQLSTKAIDIMRVFGLTKSKIYEETKPPSFKPDIKIEQGKVIFITGSSGSGKSRLLSHFYQNCTKTKINTNQIPLTGDSPALDTIAADYFTTVESFLKAGLGDVFMMFAAPAVYSDGQKYRYKLAQAVSQDTDVIFADEFCSNLDRLTASSVAVKIARHIRRSSKTLIAASAIDDIIPELAPDITIVCRTKQPPKIIYKDALWKN